MPTCRTAGKKNPELKAARLLSVDHAPSLKHITAPRQHPWRVVHACELAREVLSIVEGQLAVGMRPLVLTPRGFGAAQIFMEEQRRDRVVPISLLQTWNHVREWRRLLNDSGAENSTEVVHAHSFAAGMAAVRGFSGVAYTLRLPVEKLAVAVGNCEPDSWLARSFRVAEQFVLMRSAAVVVSDHTGRLAALERGVAAENIFLIPAPISSELLESSPEREWLRSLGAGGPETVFFVVPSLPSSSPWELRDSVLRWMRVLSVLRRSQTDVRFFFVAEPEAAHAVHELALACNLMHWVRVLAPTAREKALASADVVVCDGEHASGGYALEAMARGRAVLAADIEPHRDISPDGRGCIWFRSCDVADLAYRASFLGENPQFRRALGVAAREHCIATRSAEVVGAQYDAVYRQAFSKRKGRDSTPPKTQLVPLEVGN